MTADKGRVQTETAKPTEPTETAKPTEPEAPTASAQTEHGGLPGDVNGDGVVDIDDQRLPWVTRAYGAVLLVQGLLTVPMIVIAFMHAVGTALGGASFEPGALVWSACSWVTMTQQMRSASMPSSLARRSSSRRERPSSTSTSPPGPSTMEALPLEPLASMCRCI